MKLKPLYRDRINTLKTDMKKVEIYVSDRKSIIDEYTIILEEMLAELKKISNDENIEPNIKYIQLNEKTVDIEKVSIKIEQLFKEITTKVSTLSKEKNILLQNCIEEHTNLTEEEITTEIKKLL